MIRLLATVCGGAAVMVAVGALVVRYLPVENNALLIAAAASPFLMAAAPVGMLLLGAARRWVLTLLAAALSVVVIGTQAPRYLGSETTVPAASPVRVVSANLGMGRADPYAVVALADNSADVLVVQEVTPQAAAGLAAAGLDGIFPHRVIDPRPYAAGIGMWSRHPILDAEWIDGYQMPMVSARIRLPGVKFDPIVVGVHLAAPLVQPISAWQRDMARFPATLRELARQAGAGAVVVAGDLNSTLDMLPFRRLLGEGYRDAAEQAGAGMTRTYPNRRWRPPIVGIDHVLVRNCAATSARTVALPGSDHRGLVTTIDVPLDPTAS